MEKLFPTIPNYWRGSRELITALRALHILSVVLFMGHSLFIQDKPPPLYYIHGIGITGTLMVFIELTRYRYWLFQFTGLSVLIKVSLVGLIYLFHGWQNFILIIILLFSVVTSHLSKQIRHRFWYKPKKQEEGRNENI